MRPFRILFKYNVGCVNDNEIQKVRTIKRNTCLQNIYDVLTPELLIPAHRIQSIDQNIFLKIHFLKKLNLKDFFALINFDKMRFGMTNRINDTVIMPTAANRTIQPPFPSMKLVQKLHIINGQPDSQQKNVWTN